MKHEDYEARCSYIATLIQLVCQEDIEGIYNVAKNLLKHYSPEEVYDVPPGVIYDCYCIMQKGGVDQV